jgi:uncharacterized membrane protein
MTPDPGAIFGDLVRVCIRDDYVKDEAKVVREGVLFLVLGLCSSLATAYFLSMAGFLL